MDKPKLKPIKHTDPSFLKQNFSGHNFAVNEMNAWLPTAVLSVEEIKKICEKERWRSAQTLFQDKKYDIVEAIAKAIHDAQMKRLGVGDEK